MALVDELRRRKVIQAAAIYVAIAWGATEILVTATDTLGLPAWVSRLPMLAFILGFPLVIVYSWFRDLSRVGLSVTLVLLLITATGGLYIKMFSADATERHHPSPVPDPFATASASLAVLPFEDLTGDPETRVLAEGLAVDLTSLLSRVPQLRVVASRSSAAASAQHRAIDEIGRALGVDNVAEGRVRESADGVIIETALYDASTQYVLWSGEISVPQESLSEARQDVALELVRALNLANNEVDTVRAPVEPEAYRLYLRALYALETDYVTDESIKLLGQSVALSPNFAEGWAMLGEAYSRAVSAGLMDPESAFDKREAALERAIGIDPRLPQAYELLGEIKRNAGDASGAEAAFRRALELDPNSPYAHLRLARIFRNQGFLRASDRELEIAYSLDPLSALPDLYMASVLMNRGETGRAMRQLENILASNPKSDLALGNLQVYALLLGSPRESLARFRQTEEAGVTTEWNYALAALAYSRLGDRSSAWRVLEEAGAANTRNFWLQQALMTRQYLDGDAGALLETAHRAMEDGVNRNRLSWAGLGSLLTGDATQAAKYLEEAFQDRDWYQGNFPAVEVVDLANLALAYRTLGQDRNADEVIEHCKFRIRRLRAQEVWLPDLDYAEGVIHVLSGDSDQGIELLRRAATRGWLAFPVMEVDPKLASLRNDDRFIALLQQARLKVTENPRH